jgi:hypothetical protein
VEGRKVDALGKKQLMTLSEVFRAKLRSIGDCGELAETSACILFPITEEWKDSEEQAVKQIENNNDYLCLSRTYEPIYP